MKKILFIILILALCNTAYAEYIKPVASIITTKADIEFIKNNKHDDTMKGEVTFHYESVYWEEFGENLANDFNSFGAYFLTLEYVVKFKPGYVLYQYYYIPQHEVKKMLTMATSFNKDTYMKMTLPVMAFFEKEGKKELAGYYYRDFKLYTDKGKFIIEFFEAGKDSVIEKLSFDQTVLLKVWQILLQNTVY